MVQEEKSYGCDMEKKELDRS